MRKMKHLKGFFGIAAAISVGCLLSVNPSFSAPISAAGTHNAGYGYTHGVIEAMQEQGGSQVHDMDMMRYDKNSRMRDMDYESYKNRRYGTEGQAVKNVAGPNSALKASIDEMGSKGVYVNSIEVSPSEILTREEINSVIGQYVGKNIFMNDIQEAVNGLNKLYAEKGFVTARAYLPEQTVSNGNIKIELIESKIGNISVQNNRYTTSGYILRRMPEKSGELFDIVDLEKDVLDFNRYHDGVNLTANLKAGQQPGTTDIELIAQETFPLHIIGMMDNAGRRSTGPLRGGPAIVVDSLFHHRDQMSIGSYFSRGAISPFFDYSFPINKKDGRIGFSFSSTFARKIRTGEPILDQMGLRSNSYVYSLYYDQPLVRTRGFEFKTYAAMNYKRARTWFTNEQFNPIKIFAPQLEDTDQVTSLDLGFNLRKDTKYGIWYFNQMASMAFPIFDSESSYFKYSGGLLRLHDFSHGFIGQLRGSYQIIPNNKHIPYIDLFQTGGLATVRGYSEGLLMGKNGYYVSGELMFPLLPRTINTKKGPRNFIGNYIKGAIFADTGGVFPVHAEDYYESYFLTSIGMGLRVQLPGDLSARLYWGYPLINNKYEHHRHMGRFHFELTVEPDLDRLLARREKKPVVMQPAPQPEPKPQEPAPVEMNNYDDVRHYDYLLDGSATSL